MGVGVGVGVGVGFGVGVGVCKKCARGGRDKNMTRELQNFLKFYRQAPGQLPPQQNNLLTNSEKYPLNPAALLWTGVANP